MHKRVKVYNIECKEVDLPYGQGTYRVCGGRESQIYSAESTRLRFISNEDKTRLEDELKSVGYNDIQVSNGEIYGVSHYVINSDSSVELSHLRTYQNDLADRTYITNLEKRNVKLSFDNADLLSKIKELEKTLEFNKVVIEDYRKNKGVITELWNFLFKGWRA